MQELDDAFQRKKLALQGNKYLVGGAQSIDGDKPQRRRAVDDDIVVLVRNMAEQIGQIEFTGHFVHQLDFYADQIRGGRQQ